MNCLDREQLVELALGEAASGDSAVPEHAAARAHAGTCAECAARLEQVREQFRRLEAAMTWFDRDHAAARQRLLAALNNIKPDSLKPNVARKLKEIIAMPRTWIGSAAAAVLGVAVFFLWNGPSGQSLLAQSVQALRDVKSYQCHIRTTFSSPDGKKTETITGKLYWAAPGSIRTDTYKGDKLIEVRMMPKDKPGLDIDHRHETFTRLEPATGSVSPLLLMSKLAKYSGQADRVLEKRQIGGVSAPGLEIALARIDADAGAGTLRLWIDPKTKLPLRVDGTKESAYTMVWDQFEWNVPSEPWFNVQAPASYQDKTPTPPDVERITKQIVTGLKTFAKYSGGKYPHAKMVYGDVTSEELNHNAGLPLRGPPADTRSQVYVECLNAYAGFAQINELQRHSRDAVYHGKTVGPQDKGKVLFRWKLNDGRFRVILGDLRVEDVVEARLKQLEGK
jgi:outer membrane lipoprotein-sorting protein